MAIDRNNGRGGPLARRECRVLVVLAPPSAIWLTLLPKPMDEVLKLILSSRKLGHEVWLMSRQEAIERYCFATLRDRAELVDLSSRALTPLTESFYTPSGEVSDP